MIIKSMEISACPHCGNVLTSARGSSPPRVRVGMCGGWKATHAVTASRGHVTNADVCLHSDRASRRAILPGDSEQGRR